MRVGNEYSNSFDVRVGVHQGSVLSPRLFVIVLKALSMEFRTGCPWEILYADDLMVSAQSMDEVLVKLITWSSEMEKKGLRVNMGKKKLMVSGLNFDVLRKSGSILVVYAKQVWVEMLFSVEAAGNRYTRNAAA